MQSRKEAFKGSRTRELNGIKSFAVSHIYFSVNQKKKKKKETMSVIICHAFVVASGSGLGNSLISSKKQKLVSVANVCNIFACL